MISKKLLTSFICLNSVFLTKCETITIKNEGNNIQSDNKNELIYDNGKYIIKIKKKKNYKLEDFINDFKKVTCGNKKIVDVKVAFKFEIKVEYITTNKKNPANALESITLKLEEIVEKNYKISFDENNFYDKDYFIGNNLTKLKEELVKLNGKDMTEDDLNKNIKELKDKYLKKDDSSYYNIINTEKTDKNINIIRPKGGCFDDIKELLYKQNYEFSLLEPHGYESAPDYKTGKNTGIYNFFNESSTFCINKYKDFFYKKITVKVILEMIKNKLIEYSDKDNEGKVPYNFEIELLDKSKKKINPSNSILEGGNYKIFIKGLFITEDQNQSVKDLNNLIKELETKSTEDTPFNTSEIGNNYINQKNNEFIDLKNKLENIEFCKLFLEKNEESFKIYIGTLTNKIKLLGVDEDVQKIIKEIDKKITEFKEQINTWEYKNFSDYIDENKKIKDEKVKEYINSLITDAKNKNNGKEVKIDEYYTEDTINNEINNINTALNTKLNELKYSINLVIKDNKKFKNEEYNNKFNKLINDFKNNYKDVTYEELLNAHIILHVLSGADKKIQLNTKFYVNGSEITNLKGTITKNSKVEIEFDSSLYKDKNDDEDEGKEHNGDHVQQNSNTGNDGNGEKDKKGCCANKCKCYGDQKK